MFNIDPVAFRVGSLTVRWYALILTTGMILALFVLTHLARKKHNMSSDFTLEIFLWTIPLAILFARLGYVLPRPEFYPLNSWEAIKNYFDITQGGLTILTGAIGGLLGIYIACKRHKVALFDVLDIIVPALLVGQILGRWGNFVNQELYGLVITNPGLQWFPFAVYIQNTGHWHCANFFYESFANFIALFFFMFLAKKKLKPGIVTFGYITWYGFLRGMLEIVKIDQYTFDNGVKGAQLFSFIVMALAFIVLILIQFDVIRFKTTSTYRQKLGITSVKNDVFITQEMLDEEEKVKQKRKEFYEKIKNKIKKNKQ